MLSYHCTKLKVPLLEPLVRLQAGDFSRALSKCVFRSRVIPEVVRSDRGPEMASKVTEEFLALCHSRQVFGAALTPRHQGLVERSHQNMITTLLVLMQRVTRAFPNEWPALLPAVEYLMHTEPQGAHGLSAHDLSTAYSLAEPQDARLAPFRIPRGLPETSAAAAMFERYTE